MVLDKDLIEKLGNNLQLKKSAIDFISDTIPYKYSYNFTWLGRPVIQFPQDLIAVQEIIWKVKPDLIIETGIAHGGSLIFHASILELLGKGEVVGIDIEIRKHNKIEIEKHPLFHRITMIEGSSIDKDIVKQIHELSKNKKKVLLVLDSNHTHEHVLQELQLYSSLVNKDSYVIVFDTVVEDLPDSIVTDRPWSKGNNPKTAVWEFLKNNDRFKIDKEIENKLMITVAPSGFLKCIKKFNKRDLSE